MNREGFPWRVQRKREGREGKGGEEGCIYKDGGITTGRTERGPWIPQWGRKG